MISEQSYSAFFLNSIMICTQRRNGKEEKNVQSFCRIMTPKFFLLSDKVSLLDFVCMGTFGQRVIQGAWGVFDMCNVQQC